MTPLWKRPDGTPTRHLDPDSAIADYLEALRRAEVAGGSPPATALNGLGDAYFDKGDLVSAIDYYRQAAEVYAREGMYNNAIACCRKIRRYAPDDPQVGLLLGRFYAAKGLEADALAELESHAERQVRTHNRRGAIEALQEITRLAPARTGRREQLARLYVEDGRRDAGAEEYQAALRGYRGEGDSAAAERVRAALAELGAATASGTPIAAPAPSPPAQLDLTARVDPAPVAPLAAPDPGPRSASLEIERTSYDDEPAASLPAGMEGPALTIAQGVDDADSPRGDVGGDPTSELEAVVGRDPRAYREMIALAGRYAADSRREQAARYLLAAAEGLQNDLRWPEAVAAYRQLASLDRATVEHFSAWAECARQTGEASKVLEALAVAARWHLAHEDRQGARRVAEEMLLVDPHNAVASEVLEKVGTALPPHAT
ncbi:MAG: tetratricopeptide repeat protein [Gemmatimonadota bacterium]